MKRLFIAAAASAALALGACATATPYQPISAGSTAGGGYSERQVEQNRFLVSFAGNTLTDRRTVETYLLYRAAELTLQQGYEWFSVVDRETNRDTRLQSTGFSDPYWGGFGGFWGPSWRLYGPRYFGGGWGPWGPWGGWGGGFGSGFGGGFGSSFDYREVTRYEANAEIFLGRGAKPADDRRAFDAREVVARLGPSIMRPQPR